MVIQDKIHDNLESGECGRPTWVPGPGDSQGATLSAADGLL